jgi:hypothetical protein
VAIVLILLTVDTGFVRDYKLYFVQEPFNVAASIKARVRVSTKQLIKANLTLCLLV